MAENLALGHPEKRYQAHIRGELLVVQVVLDAAEHRQERQAKLPRPRRQRGQRGGCQDGVPQPGQTKHKHPTWFGSHGRAQRGLGAFTIRNQKITSSGVSRIAQQRSHTTAAMFTHPGRIAVPQPGFRLRSVA